MRRRRRNIKKKVESKEFVIVLKEIVEKCLYVLIPMVYKVISAPTPCQGAEREQIERKIQEERLQIFAICN